MGAKAQQLLVQSVSQQLAGAVGLDPFESEDQHPDHLQCLFQDLQVFDRVLL